MQARCFPGWLLVVMALASLLALGPGARPADSPARQIAALEAASVMCHGAAPRPHAPHRHAPRHALCPLGVALVLPGFVLATPHGLPGPSDGRLHHYQEMRLARGPPSLASHVGFPRGPPVLA